MASTMQVEIVSAEAAIFSGTARMFVAPGTMGELGILPQHTPLLTRIKAGECKLITEEGEEQYFFVSGGMLEVLPQGVTLLADTALRAADIDEAKALEAKERAEKMLADRKDDVDYAAAEAELLEAIAQLRTLKRVKKKLGQ